MSNHEKIPHIITECRVIKKKSEYLKSDFHNRNERISKVDIDDIDADEKYINIKRDNLENREKSCELINKKMDTVLEELQTLTDDGVENIDDIGQRHSENLNTVTKELKEVSFLLQNIVGQEDEEIEQIIQQFLMRREQLKRNE